MKTNRREFICNSMMMAAGAAGVGLAGRRALAGTVTPHGPERMRLGVLSDIHVDVKDGGAMRKFDKALRAFDAWKADGILACGDLADWGLDIQLEWVANKWFEVFPDGKRSDGQPVANLMHYGDHDTSGYLYRDFTKKLYPEEKDLLPHVIARNDRKATWERCFREPWAPIVKKTVKGYDFILSHFTKGEKGNESGNYVPGLEDFFARQKFDPSKPFFYSQHRIPLNTAGGKWAWGQDEGQTTKLFAKYPNLVAFCGHCHLTASDEKAIWQDAFTCVQVPSLLYSVTQGGRENGYMGNDRPYAEPHFAMPPAPCGARSQALFVTLYDNAMVIRRWNVLDEGPVGPDWVVPLGTGAARPYRHADRAAHDPAPEFPSDAKIMFKETRGKDRGGNERDFIEVSFPLAKETASTPRADDYEVKTVVIRDDVETTVDQRRVYSPGYGRSLAVDQGPVFVNIPKEKTESGKRPVRLDVTPLNAFGRRGRTISLLLRTDRSERR